MKKRTSNVSRRIVSLLMSLVLTLTLVTPAAFATEVVGGSGTAIIEGNANPADPAPGEDSENNEDKNTEDGKDEQPTNPGDEDKNPDEDNGDDASKPDGDSKDKENPDGDKKDEENKNEQPTEDENNGDDEIALLNAENAADVWAGADAEGGIDTSWYNDNDKDFKISTAAQLAGLAQLVNGGNNFSGKTIKLTADIKLNDENLPTADDTPNSWEPIGTNSKRFAGTFDGQGHTIGGLYINNSSQDQGLFGYIDKSAIVQNLIVTGSVTTGGDSTGGIVGKSPRNSGTVRNCGFYGTVTATGRSGGVVGGGKAENCWYYSDGTASNLGVCGGTATNCVVISSADPMKAAKLETLKTAAPVTGKVWSWTEGAAYPTLIDPPKTITMQPVFPDCTAVVSAGETTLNVENDYTYEVTSDTVTITVSGNSDTLYYAASESEKDYTAAEGGNLTKIDGTPFNKNDLPKTYYYGTEEDFRLLAAWNSALGRSGKTATIKDAVTLKALARMVNSGKDEMTGKTITLDANIDLNNEPWTPIGTAKHPFKGAFNGNKSTTYYTISGLTGDLFGVVNSSKIIQYVTIDGGTGRLVGKLESGTVQYCMSKAKVTDTAGGGGLVGQNGSTVKSCYYYNADSKNIPAVGGSSDKVTKCFYLADTSTFGAKSSDNGARTAEEFQLGRVAYELGGSSYVWVYDTTKAEKMPQLGRSSGTMAVANELKLTKPDNQPEGVVVTLGNDSDKKTLTDAAGNQYYYAASGYPKGVSDVPVTFTAPKGYQIVFTPATTKVDGKDYLRITGSDVEYTYSLIKADISWYENHKAEKSYAFQNSDELVGLALLVNGELGQYESFEGWTLSLKNDIDLENLSWTPIGLRNGFAGTFNGNDHAITGLSVVVATGYAGLFGNLTGTVQNLQVTGSVTASGKVMAVGGIVGYSAGGTVQNCLSNVTVNAAEAAKKPVGGVVGRNNGTVNLCWNKGNVTGAGFTGGVVGSGSGTVTNCANFGEVKGGPSYGVGGISGSGAVANSYNLGDVTGAEGRAYGISGGTVTNSYYVCKLNGAEKMAYVNDTDTKDIAYNEVNKTYTVVEDAALLVDTLNEKCNGNTPWFVNSDKGLYLPAHVLTWTGEKDDRFEGQTVTVTYVPNGGVNKDGADDPISVTVTLAPDMATGGFKAESYTILAADSEMLGFKHENGTIKATPWNTARDGTGTGYNAGSSIDISASESEGITLYAQWDAIWVGTGTKSDPYQIPSIDELTKLQEQVNGKGFDYKEKWFKLTGSIDMSNANWTPIAGFSGNLNGNHCTISGLTVNVDVGYAGLFTGVSGTFQDLTLDNPVVTGTNYCGSLSGYGIGATLINIMAKNVAVSSTGGAAGGLVGRDNNISAKNCRVEGGNITGRGRAAGIGTAVSDNSPEIINCHNSANINTTTTSSASRSAIAAGIWACDTFGAGGTFTGCTNSGTVSGQSYAAGIATAASTIKNCVNRGSVTSSGNLAGGLSNNAIRISYCGNTGTITGRGSTISREGIAGINSGIYGNVEFCYNTGVIVDSTGNLNKIYGIAAGVARNRRLKNCFSYVKDNSGKVVDIPLVSNVDVDGNITNSYYLASSATAVSSAGSWASADDFASGKVAWGVDGGTGKHENYWTQGANNYPVPIGEGTSTSYYRAKAECGTGGTVSIKSSRNFTGDADNAVYGPKGTSVTVTATPKDDTFGLKSLTLDLMGTGSTTALESGDGFTLGEANALVVATFASTGNGGSGGGTGGNGGDGDGTGTDTGDGAGDENDEGLQDGLNLEVEYDVKSLILSAYGAWGAESSGKTFAQWLKDSPEVLRALITNSLDNMAVAAMGKKTDEAKDLAALLLASLNEHSGLDGQSSDTIGKMLRKYIESGTEAAFSAWLTTGGGMASGTYESIFAQYTNSLLALADRLYTNWESSGTSLTFPQWLDAQQVTMESLSENAEEPDAEPDDTQTTEAPEDVPDGQEAEGGASSGGNSVWEVIGTVVRENPIIVWSIVAVIAALVIVGAVRRYHKVKRDERDDVSSKK